MGSSAIRLSLARTEIGQCGIAVGMRNVSLFLTFAHRFRLAYAIIAIGVALSDVDLQAEVTAPPTAPEASIVNTDTALPKACITSLKANVLALTTFGVRFSVQRQFNQLSASPAGAARPGKENCYYYRENERFYFRYDRDVGGRLISEELSYDGKVFFSGVPRQTGTSSVVKYLGDNPDDSAADSKFIKCQYLEAAGYIVPRTAKELRTSSVESLVLQFASIGKVTSVIASNNVLTVRLEIPEPAVLAAKKLDLDKMADQLRGGTSSPEEVEQTIALYQRLRSSNAVRTVEFLLDSQKAYAMLRREDFDAAGHRIQSVECEEFEYFPDQNIWLPRLCTVREYVTAPALLTQFTDEPHLTLTITAQEFSFDHKKDVSFEISYGPGSMVFDRSVIAARTSKDNQVAYQVPANNDALRSAANSALDRTKSRSWATILLIINILVIIVIAILVVFRRKSKRA